MFNLYLKTYPASPRSLVKHFVSSCLHNLQYSADSVQSSTLNEATRLFLVAVNLYHLPVLSFLGSFNVVTDVLAPPQENLGCPS